MRKKGKKDIVRKIDNLLEIPREISDNIPKITVLGFNQMLIENYIGIMEYQDIYIRIKTNIGIININGFELELGEMTTDDLIISGKIDSIDFEGTTD